MNVVRDYIFWAIFKLLLAMICAFVKFFWLLVLFTVINTLTAKSTSCDSQVTYSVHVVYRVSQKSSPSVKLFAVFSLGLNMTIIP